MSTKTIKIKKKSYKSKKHPVLEYIFKKYYNPKSPQKIITFYLSDISEGYKKCNISEPVSISNTILDLCRQDRGIDSRIPKTISKLGYDLKKKTGIDKNKKKIAGEFVFVGVGNVLKSWLVWDKKPQKITINSLKIPVLVRKFIRPDEGGLFSIIDYGDIFSIALHSGKFRVFRIQNPMKWQPNEIDGFYATEYNKRVILYPVEAKSRVTKDEINLDQLKGGFETVKRRLINLKSNVDIQQIAVKMINNGIDIAIFPLNKVPEIPEHFVRIKFNPPLENWK